MDKSTYEALRRIMYGVTNHYHKFEKSDVNQILCWIDEYAKEIEEA